MKRGTGWPIAVATILGLTIAANVWIVRVANRDPSVAVEPDYYQKALHWDDELAQRARNDSLGWRLTPALHDTSTDAAGTLDVTLEDHGGTPLSGARISCRGHSQHAGEPPHHPAPARRGSWRVSRRFSRRAAWDVGAAVRCAPRSCALHRRPAGRHRRVDADRNMMGAFAILIASLVGSPHCAAMCGPFVAFYSGATARSGSPRAVAHLAYSGGRLAAYLLLGAIAGALGAGLDGAGVATGIGRLAGVVAGVVMVAWGVSTWLAVRGVRLGMPRASSRLHGTVAGMLRRVREQRSTARAAVTGLATALLPCGWLYVFVAAAGGTGSPLRGAALMLFFWTGTLPVMLSLGAALQRVATPIRSRLPLVSAAFVVVLGLFTIAGRLHMFGDAAPVIAEHAAHAAPR